VRSRAIRHEEKKRKIKIMMHRHCWCWCVAVALRVRKIALTACLCCRHVSRRGALPMSPSRAVAWCAARPTCHRRVSWQWRAACPCRCCGAEPHCCTHNLVSEKTKTKEGITYKLVRRAARPMSRRRVSCRVMAHRPPDSSPSLS